MVVFQVQVAYFSAVESEGDPPVTGYRHAPSSGPVVVVFDEAFQASMATTPYSHAFPVYGNTVHIASHVVLNLGEAAGN
jgi:hypothetical protein